MSTLGIENIEHINGTNAMTINSTGKVDLTRNNQNLFAVQLGADQNIATNVRTTVGLNTKIFDEDDCFNTSNYRYTPKVAGFYFIYGSIQWIPKSADDNVYLETAIFKNGSDGGHSTGNSPYLNSSGGHRPREVLSVKAGAAKETNVGGPILTHLNGTTDYLTLTAYIYNYTNSSATDNILRGHGEQSFTQMFGYRVA